MLSVLLLMQFFHVLKISFAIALTTFLTNKWKSERGIYKWRHTFYSMVNVLLDSFFSLAFHIYIYIVRVCVQIQYKGWLESCRCTPERISENTRGIRLLFFESKKWQTLIQLPVSTDNFPNLWKQKSFDRHFLFVQTISLQCGIASFLISSYCFLLLAESIYLILLRICMRRNKQPAFKLRRKITSNWCRYHSCVSFV